MKQLTSLSIGMNLSGIMNKTCDGCMRGKMSHANMPSEGTSRSTHPLQLIHSDVCGPMEVQSLGHSNYFIIFNDDFSRYTCVLCDIKMKHYNILNIIK